MSSARSFILAACVATPALCLAEPAVIGVFEAQARSAPDRSAPVVHVFVEGAKVSVSEEANGGWRKIRLPDGGVAFVEEGALALPGGLAPSPAIPGPAAAVRPAPVVPAPAAPQGFTWAATRIATELRSAPDPSGTLLHQVAAGTAVLVSTEVVRGFRRVRVPDGRAGFAADADLELSAAPPATVPAPADRSAPRSPPPATAPAPTPVPRVYVRDLDHFAELVKDDSRVGPMAATLQQRRTGAYAVAGVGLVVSATLIALGASNIGNAEVSETQLTVLGAAAALGVSALVAWLVYPPRADFLDAVNHWNTRHPDHPFELTPGPPRQVALPSAAARAAPPGLTRVSGLALVF